MDDTSGYGEHLVAFADLLGFREIAKAPERSANILALLRLFSTLRGEFHAETEQVQAPLTVGPPVRGVPWFFVANTNSSSSELTKTIYRPAVTVFSDNIVASFSMNELRKNGRGLREAMGSLEVFLGFVAWNAMDAGLLVRGGLSLGELFHEDGVIAGRALIEAYEIESKVAVYPRFVIGKSITENPEYAKIASTRGLARVYKDFDGLECVNYMPNLVMRLGGKIVPNDQKRVAAIRNNVDEQLSAHRRAGDLRKVAKWEYFRNYLSSAE